jgi:phosphohistidine phosphatase
MDLYLVRHAVAYDRDPSRWPDDADRPLTPEGEREFAKAARGLPRVAKPPERVLSSPFPRAWRTAEILSEEAGWPPPERFEYLEADRPVAPVLGGLPADMSSVALVGHEPGMSELAWLLLAGEPGERAIRFKKGAVAKLRTDDRPAPGGAWLVWLTPPDVLRKS